MKGVTFLPLLCAAPGRPIQTEVRVRWSFEREFPPFVLILAVVLFVFGGVLPFFSFLFVVPGQSRLSTPVKQTIPFYRGESRFSGRSWRSPFFFLCASRLGGDHSHIRRDQARLLFPSSGLDTSPFLQARAKRFSPFGVGSEPIQVSPGARPRARNFPFPFGAAHQAPLQLDAKAKLSLNPRCQDL